MNITHYGISLDTLGEFGSLEQLQQALATFQAMGFSLVEIDLSPLALVMDGKIRAPQLEEFRRVLSNFNLQYSIHSPNRLNLAFDPRHDLCCRLLHCQIEICNAIGGNRVVYHSGLQALDDVARGVRRQLLTDEELRAGAHREVDALKALAPVAADAGVVICMENGDPHQWEHSVLAQFNVARKELLTYHPRLHPRNIIRQLEAIDHSNVAMTLDVAHLYIAANDMEFDYLEAIEDAAPWVKHLHVNDNFGRLDHGFDKEADRWAYGEADIHLPPGWGSIPYDQVLPRLRAYEGALILEIKSGFEAHLSECLSTMQRMVAEFDQFADDRFDVPYNSVALTKKVTDC